MQESQYQIPTVSGGQYHYSVKQVRLEKSREAWDGTEPAYPAFLESVASVQLHLVAAELNGFKFHLHTVNTCLSHNLFSVMCFALLCFLLISQLKLAPSIVLSS